MFYDIFRFIRGVWDAVLLPYVILSIANLASDGWEAVTHVPDTLVVLFYFLCGCSHKTFPLSRSAVEAQRAAMAAKSETTTTAGGASSAPTAAASSLYATPLNPTAAASGATTRATSTAFSSEPSSPATDDATGVHGSPVGNPSANQNTMNSHTVAVPASATARHRADYHSNSEDSNDADSERENSVSAGLSASAAHATRVLAPRESAASRESNGNTINSNDGASAGSPTLQGQPNACSGGPFVGVPIIQRRLLLGKKGEVEEWLPALRGRLLIPPLHPLSVSRSLHQLVSIVIGPIQQPTVATMPTRHPEPQWPPHFLKTTSVSSSSCSPGGGGGGGPGSGGSDGVGSTGGSNSNNSGSSGGGSSTGSIGGASGYGDPSTDDYSSSNSSASPNTLRHRTAMSASGGSVGSPRYRQASSVVYQRVSSRHLDFSNSRVAPHLIASITAHHVLSYPATRQKVLVMDLDETLCYVSTTTANMAGPPTFSEVIPTASGAELFHVWVRPYARLFLSTAAKLFNLVLFTSASKPYADTILQRIDPEHLLKLRYYRQDCRLVPRGLLKKMCAVAGMKAVSSGSVGRHSEGERTTGERGGGGGGYAGSSPLGTSRLLSPSPSSTSATSDHACSSGEAARTSQQVSLQRELSLRRRLTNNWGDGGSSENTEVPSSGAEMSDSARSGGDGAGDSSSGGKGATVVKSALRSGADASRGLVGGGSSRNTASSTPSDSGLRSPHGEEDEDTYGGGNSSGNGGKRGEAGDDLPELEKITLNEHAKVLVKDLRVLKVPPELLVMIDNSEECTLVNPENALIVSPFIPSLTKGGAGEKTASAAAAEKKKTRRDGRDSSGDSLNSSNSATPAISSSAGDTSPTADSDNNSSNNNVGNRTSVDGEAERRNSGGGTHGRSPPDEEEDVGEENGDNAGVDDALLMGDDMNANDGSEEDEVLLALLPMLECLLVVPDVRSILRLGKLY